MSITIQVNRSLDGKFQKLSDMLEGYAEIYTQKMATELVLNSPVDTGAYMESFNVGPSAFGSSSRGRQRNQPWQPYADEAIARLTSQASSLKGSTSIQFTNGSPHAYEVEYDHGYAPFGKTAREHGRIAREAAQMAQGML